MAVNLFWQVETEQVIAAMECSAALKSWKHILSAITLSHAVSCLKLLLELLFRSWNLLFTPIFPTCLPSTWECGVMFFQTLTTHHKYYCFLLQRVPCAWAGNEIPSELTCWQLQLYPKICLLGTSELAMRVTLSICCESAGWGDGAACQAPFGKYSCKNLSEGEK